MWIEHMLCHPGYSSSLLLTRPIFLTIELLKWTHFRISTNEKSGSGRVEMCVDTDREKNTF